MPALGPLRNLRVQRVEGGRLAQPVLRDHAVGAALPHIGGHRHDGDVGRARVAPQARADVGAVHAGHVQVEQDHHRLFPPRHVQALAPAGVQGAIALPFQRRQQQYPACARCDAGGRDAPPRAIVVPIGFQPGEVGARMPYLKKGGRRQLTIRLLPDVAEKLAAIAKQRGVTQTAIIEGLIRGLPDPSPPPPRSGADAHRSEDDLSP